MGQLEPKKNVVNNPIHDDDVLLEYLSVADISLPRPRQVRVG